MRFKVFLFPVLPSLVCNAQSDQFFRSERLIFGSPEPDGPDRYRHVTRTLDKNGYKIDDIEKIQGGNWLRYFQEILRP